METSRDDLARHERARDDLLTHIARVLMDDPRIVAAWLPGSLAYGTADAWSDLDLHVIVADEHYTDIVARREDLYARCGRSARSCQQRAVIARSATGRRGAGAQFGERRRDRDRPIRRGP